MLFGVIKVEAAILVELLAFLSALSGLSVVRVKLVVQVDVLWLAAAPDEGCVLLHSVGLS